MGAKRKSNALGVVCALGGGVAWGFSGACAQYVFSAYALDPLWTVSVRIMVAAAVLFAGCAIAKGKRLFAPVSNVRDALRIVAFSLFGVTFTQFTYLMAIDASNAGTATMLEYTGPAIVMVYVCLRSHRLPHVREITALLLVAVGVFALATHGQLGQLSMTPGALFWGMLAAFSMLLYTVIPEPLLARYDDVSVLAWAMALGAVVMGVWQHPWTDAPVMGLGGWIALIGGLTLVGTALAFLLYFHALDSIGPTRTSILASVEVVSATVISALWLGTKFEVMDLVGLVCILATVPLLSGSSVDGDKGENGASNKEGQPQTSD